jgi:hypothetical protein
MTTRTKSDLTMLAGFFAIVVLMLGAVKIIASTLEQPQPVYVTGKLVDTYTEDNMEIAVIQSMIEETDELGYYFVSVPKEYLTEIQASNPKRQGLYFKYDVHTTPKELVHWRHDYSIMK